MNVIQLPSEIISEIASHLSPLALESLARTFAKPLTPVCLVMMKLRYRIQETKNAHMMMRLFPVHPCPYVWYVVWNEVWWDSATGMERVFGSYSEDALLIEDIQPFAHIEHLPLQGDLGWLQAPTEPIKLWITMNNRIYEHINEEHHL
jgi:hypothetical protein